MVMALAELLPCPLPLPTLGQQQQQQQPSCGLSHNGKRRCVPSEQGVCRAYTRQALGAAETAEERLWHQFFVDPRQWWDNRADKPSPRHPDFRHKVSRQVLWLNSRLKPEWVDLQLAKWDAGAGDGEREAMVERLSRRCEDGELSEAVEAFDVLVQRGCRVPDSVLYHLLKRCSREKDLVLGREVHSIARNGGYESDAFVATHILGMYAAHGKLEDAVQVFGKVEVPNAYMWSSIILAHARLGRPAEAIAFYRQMRESGVKPDNHIFVAVLKACASATDLVAGKEVHADILGSDVKSNSFVGSSLVNMYAKCGSLGEARTVFDALVTKTVVTWNAMIVGYAQQGLREEVFHLYDRMQLDGLQANKVTFVCLLQSCASLEALHEGKQLHKEIRQRGLDADLLVGNCLVDMYCKCRSVEDARRVFDGLPTRDVVTWTAMIGGYANQGMAQEALSLYASMQQESMILGDRVTYVCLLKACASIGALHQGRQLHMQIELEGLAADVVIGNCLVDMYSKCGSVGDACQVFDSLPTKDVVTWNAMIAGYSQRGLGKEALDLYDRMQLMGLTPADHITFLCLLQACASVGALHQGKQLHAQIRDRGLESDASVCSSLVDMYAKCGSLEDARDLFSKLPTRDVVTWNAMIAGYTQQGLGREALGLYASMQQEGTTPNHLTFVSLLQACASVGAVHSGRELHAEIQEQGLEANVMVGNCLVDMYSKCGSLEEARRAVDRLPVRDVVTWSALLNGYAEHGDGQKAVQCFDEMCQQGVEPNESTFVSLLVACSHAGLVEEGQRYFKMMVEEHGIAPTDDHYNCMVDLLGRSGHLDDAESFLQTKPFQNRVVGWTSLLSACKNHGDAERGRRCFEHLTELEPGNASAYVLLGTIYANAGRWEDVATIERLRKSARAWKKAAKVCIEVQNKVHEFTVGEERADIALKLKSVNTRLKVQGGHVPQTQLVLRAVSEQEKEDALCGHAEKLALAYGLLNTPDGTPLLVTKNLRMCNDCHSSTKIMSRLEQREIIVRDAHRVHRFLDGFCSCGDRH